jgi:hypothetical protein
LSLSNYSPVFEQEFFEFETVHANAPLSDADRRQLAALY